MFVVYSVLTFIKYFQTVLEIINVVINFLFLGWLVKSSANFTSGTPTWLLGVKYVFTRTGTFLLAA